MIHAFASGELVRDPEKRQTKAGNDYATALVRDGDVIVSVTCFDSTLVDRLMELRKGDPVSVSGRLQVSAYTGKDGEPKCGLQVTVNEMMSGPVKTTKAPPRARRDRGGDGTPESRAPAFNDEILF